jgi:hypothetical protein
MFALRENMLLPAKWTRSFELESVGMECVGGGCGRLLHFLRFMRYSGAILLVPWLIVERFRRS